MNKLVMFLASLLVFPAAFAADNCRNINGHAFSEGYQAPCEFNGTDYDGCYIGKIRGVINGSWVSYVQDDWFLVLDDFGLPTPYLTFYNREFEVFTSKQGMVWGDAQFTYDTRAWLSGGPAIPTIVTGGTGIYEDATGWITLINLDGDFYKSSVHGRVCGPNIEGD